MFWWKSPFYGKFPFKFLVLSRFLCFAWPLFLKIIWSLCRHKLLFPLLSVTWGAKIEHKAVKHVIPQKRLCYVQRQYQGFFFLAPQTHPRMLIFRQKIEGTMLTLSTACSVNTVCAWGNISALIVTFVKIAHSKIDRTSATSITLTVNTSLKEYLPYIQENKPIWSWNTCLLL